MYAVQRLAVKASNARTIWAHSKCRKILNFNAVMARYVLNVRGIFVYDIEYAEWLQILIDRLYMNESKLGLSINSK